MSIKNKFLERFREFADTKHNEQMGSTITGPYGGDPAMSEEAYSKLLTEIDEFIASGNFVKEKRGAK